jgi:hypothetical protein
MGVGTFSLRHGIMHATASYADARAAAAAASAVAQPQDWWHVALNRNCVSVVNMRAGCEHAPGRAAVDSGGKK